MPREALGKTTRRCLHSAWNDRVSLWPTKKKNLKKKNSAGRKKPVARKKSKTASGEIEKEYPSSPDQKPKQKAAKAKSPVKSKQEGPATQRIARAAPGKTAQGRNGARIPVLASARGEVQGIETVNLGQSKGRGANSRRAVRQLARIVGPGRSRFGKRRRVPGRRQLLRSRNCKRRGRCSGCGRIGSSYAPAAAGKRSRRRFSRKLTNGHKINSAGDSALLRSR